MCILFMTSIKEDTFLLVINFVIEWFSWNLVESLAIDQWLEFGVDLNPGADWVVFTVNIA